MIHDTHASALQRIRRIAADCLEAAENEQRGIEDAAKLLANELRAAPDLMDALNNLYFLDNCGRLLESLRAEPAGPASDLLVFADEAPEVERPAEERGNTCHEQAPAWTAADIEEHDGREIGAAEAVAGGGGQQVIDTQGASAPAAPNAIGGNADADGTGQLDVDVHHDGAHPSALLPETPAAQQQVQPADHLRYDNQTMGVGGHPIPETPRDDAAASGQSPIGTHMPGAARPNSETPPRAAGGGHPCVATQRIDASPSPHPAGNGRGRGQSSGDTHMPYAASTYSPPAKPAGAAGHSLPGTQREVARPVTSPGHSKRGLAAIASISGTIARSLLDTFQVNGRPVGDITPAEARGWAASRERDARFVRLLTQGVPDTMRIRECLTGADAQRCWELAENGAAVVPPTIDAHKPTDYRETTNA